jgi:hypothetical protein
VDETFTALVRGPGSKLPRGYLFLIPAWIAAIVGLLWYGWTTMVGPLAWWYIDLAVGGLAFSSLVLFWVMVTVRRLAFRVDLNGIRLGVRSKRKRPRRRQVYLWWAHIEELSIMPRHYGLMLEITLSPTAQLTPHRGWFRQILLMLAMLVLPAGLGRGAPRLTEPRTTAPHYRIRICDVTPEELGMVLAPLAPADVDIMLLSRRRRELLARRVPAAAVPAA